MTIIAGLLAVGLVAVIVLSQRHQARLEAAWTTERAELLERIQRPAQRPTAAPVLYQAPELEDDELELIGVIQDPDDFQDPQGLVNN